MKLKVKNDVKSAGCHTVSMPYNKAFIQPEAMI